MKILFILFWVIATTTASLLPRPPDYKSAGLGFKFPEQRELMRVAANVGKFGGFAFLSLKIFQFVLEFISNHELSSEHEMQLMQDIQISEIAETQNVLNKIVLELQKKQCEKLTHIESMIQSFQNWVDSNEKSDLKRVDFIVDDISAKIHKLEIISRSEKTSQITDLTKKLTQELRDLQDQVNDLKSNEFPRMIRTRNDLILSKLTLFGKNLQKIVKKRK